MVNLLNITDDTELCSQIRFLKYLDEFADDHNLICNKFEDIAEYIGVSYSTFKNYIKSFRTADLLKFSYKVNTIMLNPAIFSSKANQEEYVRGGFSAFISD